MKNKLISILMVILVVLSFVGCGNQNNNAKDDVEQKKESAEQKTTVHKIGEQAKLPIAKVSVTNIRKLNTEDTVYAIEVEIENTSKQDLKSSFLDNYTLKTVENRKGEAINNQELNGELLLDTIKPGEKLKGEIAYELQKNDTPKTFEISYDDENHTVFNVKK
ncbi:DUF4352 domain-containing protein [Clostridium sporogenes]|uniref:DUF4352 domain-containing protein n=2 Tax=Clostridium TaxID=1485 RepID=A0A0D1BZJ8_CLOBO|nr:MULTISPECIES: DUF4352 domain-containing protein [Clostridium]MBE6075541.1 DUF4352 domain-containing protein [Clostridium lundense]MDU2832550.1 DUF4352 domain-containing protein [Clostridium botulinum]EDU36502.1 hypothetical protein CLOSPO_02670 [Clostridium sporogenes ATCC 15579]KIS24176.1 hypothetical protein N495_11495 [Clostridium botulinum B2 450]MCW6092523.1 DUF4352 domain-containing protein [Clostridium sporogenes]